MGAGGCDDDNVGPWEAGPLSVSWSRQVSQVSCGLQRLRWMNPIGLSCSHGGPSGRALYRQRHATFIPLSHSPPENMPCLEAQAQEKNQHSRSQAEFRKQPYSRMTWSKNDVVSHERTERQKKSEKQVELCNIKVETNGLALPDGQAHR